MKNKSGFTLLEILVAIFIFAIVSLITSVALHEALVKDEIITTHRNRLFDIQKALLIFTRDIENIKQRNIKNKEGLEQNFLDGIDQKICFTYSTPSINECKLKRSCYYVLNEEFIRETWDVLDQTSETQSSKKILLTHTKNIKFEFFNQLKQNLTSWPSANTSEYKSDILGVRFTLILDTEGSITQFYVIKPTFE